jgi:hypothetical protein
MKKSSQNTTAIFIAVPFMGRKNKNQKRALAKKDDGILKRFP